MKRTITTIVVAIIIAMSLCQMAQKERKVRAEERQELLSSYIEEDITIEEARRSYGFH